MDKKKLVICGDSFMSPTSNSPGTHFSEIVSSKMGFELVPLARSAMSNGGIVSQLEYAISLRPDMILFNTTFADRMEFTITDDNLSDMSENITCKDFYYGERKDLSCQIMNNADCMIGSESIESLIRGDFFGHKSDSFNKFLFDIYNRSWKIKIDQHIIYSVSHQLYRSGIPFLLMLDIINASKKMEWIPKENLGFEWSVLDKIRLEKADNHFVDPGYHTTIDVQERLAEDTLSRIKDLI